MSIAGSRSRDKTSHIKDVTVIMVKLFSADSFSHQILVFVRWLLTNHTINWTRMSTIAA
ncbi:hypothetical protein QUB58_04825 [Microcoleus sp. B4-D1]